MKMDRAAHEPRTILAELEERPSPLICVGFSDDRSELTGRLFLQLIQSSPAKSQKNASDTGSSNGKSNEASNRIARMEKERMKIRAIRFRSPFPGIEAQALSASRIKIQRNEKKPKMPVSPRSWI